MLRKNLTVTIKPNGRIEVEIHSLEDALALQRNLNESITQAIQHGSWGAQNGVVCDGDASHLRFQVHVGKTEQMVAAYAHNKNTAKA